MNSLKRITAWMLLAVVVALLPRPAVSQMTHNHGKEPCQDITFACAVTATPYFDAMGQLWLAWTVAGRVMVSASDDLGKSYTNPTPVNEKPAALDFGPDARPALVWGQQGPLYVAYTVFKDKSFNGQVMFSRSLDGAASFDPPRPLTDDPESQRFPALMVDDQGTLFAAWLDKRHRAQAHARGEKYPGAGLAFAVSRDSGKTFSRPVIAVEPTCECCRIAVTRGAKGQPVILFRNIFAGSQRDHAVVTFTDLNTPGKPVRVSDDGWATEACPHHGPSLSVTADGTTHAVWFSGGGKRKGLFYAYSTDGKTFSVPMAVGAPDRAAAHPAVLALGKAVFLTWKEFDGENTTIRLQRSGDGGRTFETPTAVVVTPHDTDHPLLVAHAERAYLSLLVRKEGYRLLPLEALP
jgi:hypothetical protein